MTTVTAADLNRRLRDLNKRHDKALKDAITALTASAVNQAALIAALANRIQAVNQSIALSAGVALDVTILWPVEWPDLGYNIVPVVTTGNAVLGLVHATPKALSKTTAQCEVTLLSTVAVGTAGLYVLGVRA